MAVRLTPRGGCDRIDGIVEAGARMLLKARVAAPAVDGAANEALVRLLARAAGVAPSAAAVTAGATARVKQVRLDGDPAAMAGRLAAHLRP